MNAPSRPFRPERLVIPEGSAFSYDAGLPEPTVSCDYCRKQLVDGDAYYRITLGMDDAPSFLGDGPADGPLVMDTTETLFCHRCEPAVSQLMDGLLTALWKLRQPDGTEGNPEAFADEDTQPLPSGVTHPPEEPCPTTVKTSS